MKSRCPRRCYKNIILHEEIEGTARGPKFRGECGMIAPDFPKVCSVIEGGGALQIGERAVKVDHMNIDVVEPPGSMQFHAADVATSVCSAIDLTKHGYKAFFQGRREAESPLGEIGQPALPQVQALRRLWREEEEGKR